MHYRKCEGLTNGWTDTPSYRVATSRLKIELEIESNVFNPASRPPSTTSAAATITSIANTPNPNTGDVVPSHVANTITPNPISEKIVRNHGVNTHNPINVVTPT